MTMIAREELIVPPPAEALAALLDIPVPATGRGEPVPPLWHWLYLLERPRQSDLSPDGHPRVGVPAPPGPGYNRMFAGGRVTQHSPLVFGERATRTVRVIHRADKAGRSGPLVFMTTRAEIRQDGRLAVIEEQDIVYRKRTTTGAATVKAVAAEPAAAQAPPLLGLDVDPVVLFRFSALTYNSHRIHYDRDYASSEGYPGLVVHGPLQALLMGEVFRRAGEFVPGRQFSFRLVAPTFGSQRIDVIRAREGLPAGLAVRDGAGTITATGELTAATVEP
jgi:3-methylfumaryl-CoA hydratase